MKNFIRSSSRSIIIHPFNLHHHFLNKLKFYHPHHHHHHFNNNSNNIINLNNNINHNHNHDNNKNLFPTFLLQTRTIKTATPSSIDDHHPTSSSSSSSITKPSFQLNLKPRMRIHFTCTAITTTTPTNTTTNITTTDTSSTTTNVQKDPISSSSSSYSCSETNSSQICNHINTHEFSKHAYEHGIVLVECPSCKNRHLIADHLQWFTNNSTADDPNFSGNHRNIVDIMRAKGEKVKRGRIESHDDQVIEIYDEPQQ